MTAHRPRRLARLFAAGMTAAALTAPAAVARPILDPQPPTPGGGSTALALEAEAAPPDAPVGVRHIDAGRRTQYSSRTTGVDLKRAPAQIELFRVNDTPTKGVLLQWKIGSPFLAGGTYGTRRLHFKTGVPTPIAQLRQSALKVTNHMCHVRRFCGRHGGHDRYVPFLLLGRAQTSRFAAERGPVKPIYITAAHSPADDIVAHEFGHLMDKTYAAGVRARVQSRQGDEVEEALADMFAYDYDRDNATYGENRVGAGGAPARDWQTPGNVTRNHDGNPMTPALPHPAQMLDYACDASSRLPHFNSTILSHGYWLFVQDVGHDVAGDVLHGVPAKLPAHPKFIDVMRTFKAVALERHGTTAKQAAIDAFKTGVGIGVQDPPGC